VRVLCRNLPSRQRITGKRTVDVSVEAIGCAVLACAVGLGRVVAGVIEVGVGSAIVIGRLVNEGSAVTVILVVNHDVNEANS